MQPASLIPIYMRVTVSDAPCSAAWRGLWERLLAPLPVEAAPEASMRVSVEVEPVSAIEGYIAAQLDEEAR